MLNCRRIIPRHSLKRRVLSTSMPHEKKSGTGIIVWPTLFAGAGFGAAYAVEHKYIPDNIAEKLSFLSPLQNLLRENGFGNKDSSDEESIAELHRPIDADGDEKPEETAAEDDKSEGPLDAVVVDEDSSQIENNDASDAVPDAPIEVAVDDEVSADQQDDSAPAETETCTLPPADIPAEPPVEAAPAGVVAPSPSSSFASDSEKLIAQRVQALDRTLDSISQDMSAMQAEAELALLKDLQDLDENGLRARLVALNAELTERIRWESLRQQQAIQAAEAQYAQQYGGLLTQQRSELMMEAERKVFEKEKDLIRSYLTQLEDMKHSNQQDLAAKLAEQKAELASASAADLDKAQKALTDDLTRGFMLEMAQVKEAHVKKLLEVQSDVTQTNREVAELRDIVSEHFDKVVISCDVHALSAAVLMMERSLLAGKSVKTEVAAVRSYAPSDELISAVLNSLPRSAVTTGVPTMAAVKERFRVVKEETRKAGLAPENAPPMVGQLIGNLLAMVSVQPSVAVSGEGIEAILSRAAVHVDSGNLSAALDEIEDIKGYPRTMMKDWESMVRDRLAADLAAQTLRAAAAVKHLQFVG